MSKRKIQWLSFPVIKDKLPEAPSMTMDEFVDFIMLCLDSHVIDKKVYWSNKRLEEVNVPFHLSPELRK